MPPPTVQEIVTAYLEEHGYDGLLSDNCECACLTADVPACDDIGSNCEAGHKIAGCNGECGMGSECEWHMHPGLPTPIKRSE